MVDVTIGGENYTNVSIDIPEEYDADRTETVARTAMRGVIGDSISDEAQPKWAQDVDMFTEPDWTLPELEAMIEEKIIEVHRQQDN